jgi:hypothetical protein
MIGCLHSFAAICGLSKIEKELSNLFFGALRPQDQILLVSNIWKGSSLLTRVQLQIQDEKGRLPLHNMVESVSADLVEVLLDAYPTGALTRDKEGTVSLHTALAIIMECDHWYLVAQVLPDRAPQTATIRVCKGRLPIHLAAGRAHSMNFLMTLVECCPESLLVR